MAYTNNNGQSRVGIRSGVSSLDSDAQAFITAASITDTTQKSAINTLVTQLKNYGIWTKMKALYPFVGGNASAHKFNLKDPRDLNEAFRITFNGGFTHSSTGVLPNGTNSFGNTNLIPSTTLSATNAHQFFYFRTSLPISHQSAYGCETSGTNRMAFYPFTFNIGWISDIYDYSASRISANSGDSTGAVMMTRANANSHKIFRNNVQIASTTNATTGTRPSIPYIFGSLNVNGQNLYPDSNELAFGSIGDGLTDAEAANFYTAVQTFQTTLGRQVGVPIVADTDAQAFLNAAVITDQTQATAINTLVTDLKSANIWTKMKAIYPFVGGTATTHKYNLKDPRDLDAAFRLTFSGGWVHSSNGVLPNGTTGYANTYLIPSTVQILNSNGFGYYTPSLNTTLSADVSPMGTYTLNEKSSTMGYLNNNTKIASRLNYAIITSSTLVPIGLLSAQKTSNTLTTLYKNNTNVGSGTSGGSLSIYPFYFGTPNVEGTPYSAGYVNHEFRLVYISDGLDSTDITNLYTAVQAYQTTLSRNV